MVHQDRQNMFSIVKHEEIKVIEIVFKDKITSQQFRTGNELLLKEISESRIGKVIIDMEKTTFGVSEEDHLWFKDHFLPQAINANLRRIAFVEPGLTNTLSIANLLYPYFPADIDFEIFDNFENASKWVIND